jgi:hypothetical protein
MASYVSANTGTKQAVGRSVYATPETPRAVKPHLKRLEHTQELILRDARKKLF